MSLAAKLAEKAKEVKLNPNAKPLTAEDADLDRLAIEQQLKQLQTLVEAPPGSFRALRLNHLITKDGKKVMPTNGFFIPQTQEEYDMLHYYLELGTGLVEVVPGEPEDKKHG